MTSAIDPNIIVVGSPVSKSAMKTQLTTAASEITELQNRPGRRNRIINGAMQIDQRNAGTAQTVTTSSAYTLDRWIVLPLGASVTSQRVAGPSGYQHTAQITGAAGVTAISFGQKIESANTADLVNQNVTLSATISNSLLTTVTWSAFYANAVDNFSTTTLIASGSFTVTSTATQYSATFNAGANAANGIVVYFNVGAQISGTLKITGVQLELGSVLSTFERLSIGETMLLCQRYYEKSYNDSGKPGSAPGGGNATFSLRTGSLNGAGSNFPFNARKRATPTMAIYDGAGTPNAVSYYTSSWNNGGSVSSSPGYQSSFYIQTDIASSLLINFDWTASSEL